MNRKSKLFFSIMSLCFSIAVLCFGVYSAVSVNYSVSGSLSYTVEDVFVDIETTLYMSTEDYNTAKSNISTNITTLETNLPNTTPSNMYKTTYRDPHSTYNNGNVNTEDTITFNNEDNELPINYGAYSQGNTAYAYYIVIAITNHGQDIINAQIDLGDTGTLNSIVDTNASYVNIQGKTETSTTTEYIIIAMALDNAVQSVNQSFNFNITIGMGEFVAEEITDMLFTFDEQNKTASLLSYTGTDTIVDIPESVGTILSDTKTMHFADVNEIMALMSSESEFEMFHLFRFVNITSSLGNAENQLLFSWASANSAATDIDVEFPSQCEISYDFYVQNMLPLGNMGGYVLLAPVYELVFGFVNSLTLEVDGEIVEPNPSAIMDAMSGNISEGYFNKLISIGSATTQEELSQYQSYFPIKFTNISYLTVIEGNDNDYTLTSIGSVDNSLTSSTFTLFPPTVEQINFPSDLTYVSYAISDTQWYNTLTTSKNFDGTVTAKDGQTKYYVKAPDTNLTSVDITDVKFIFSGAFEGCSSLTSITIPESQKIIGEHTFRGCSALTEIVIPEGVTTIGEDALGMCDAITTLDIPTTLKRFIGGTSYFSYEGLRVNIKDLDAWAEIDFITLNDNKRDFHTPNPLSHGALLYENDVLVEGDIVLEGVTKIGASAFDGYDLITSITLPEGVTSIGKYAFWDSGITSINIPSTVKNIGEMAFRNANLQTVDVDENNLYYSDDESGVLFNKDKTELIYYPSENVSTSYAIPTSVETISGDAFNGCKYLTTIVLSENIINFKQDYENSSLPMYSKSFSNCNSLSSIIVEGQALANILSSGIDIGGLYENITQGEVIYIKTGLSVTGGYLNSTNFNIIESVTVSGKDGTYTQYTRK